MKKNRIIVIDDEIDFLESVRRGLITSGFKNIRIESDPRRAASALENGEVFDAALIDITMPEMSGIELLQIVKRCSPRTECVMVTALDEARAAVECLKKGAYDYLVKPISKENLISALNRALERKRLLDIVDIGKQQSAPKLNTPEAFAPIVTADDRMFRILKEAELHAAGDTPLLITGETGTGKELLARAIHASSPRAGRPFIPINMDAQTGTLFDAEFFGHTKGAFTGADRERSGHLEAADTGTLFLDEIGNLHLELQGKLLRVLQDGEFIKIGTSRPVKVDVRIIAATNKDLESMMAKNQFRKDLYYRLSGGWLHLPPLRERKGDIPLLIGRFMEELRGDGVAGIDDDTLSMLAAYDYPGNIRELRSIVQSAMTLSRGKPITACCLPAHLVKKIKRLKTGSQASPEPLPTLAELEKAHILRVYRMTDRNKAESARMLGIGINTLRRKLSEYGIS